MRTADTRTVLKCMKSDQGLAVRFLKDTLYIAYSEDPDQTAQAQSDQDLRYSQKWIFLNDPRPNSRDCNVVLAR